MKISLLHWLEQYLYRCIVKRPANLLIQKQAKEGSIIIVALWSLFFLSALVIAIASYVWPHLDVAAKLSDRTKMHYLAKAGVKKAMSEIDKAQESFCALKDSWSNNIDAFKQIELGEGEFSIKYQSLYSLPSIEEIRYGLIDEERKININKAPYAVLKKLFEIVGGISSQEAGDIASSIIDWRDIDDELQVNGAESGYYLTLEPAYLCKNDDFQLLEELLLVKGVTRNIFDKVKDRITVYTTGAININTADKLVLESLQMSHSLAEEIIHFRNGNDGKEATADDNVFKDTATIATSLSNAENLTQEELIQLNNIVNSGLLSVVSNNFMGESFGSLRNKDQSLKIIFVFDRNKTIKYWREN